MNTARPLERIAFGLSKAVIPNGVAAQS
jgi:hypothetical protein